MTLKRRLYLQFVVAILPLALLVLFQAVARNDLPERVNAALRAYDLSLDAGNAFKEFLNGVADAIDSGRLSGDAVDALKRAQASEQKLAEVSPGDREVADRITRVADAIPAQAPVAAILPLKAEVQSLRTALIESSDGKRKALAALVESEESGARRRQEILVAGALGAVALALFMAFVLRRLVGGITRPLTESITLAHAIADGRLDNHIATRGDDEMGQLLKAMAAMQDNLSRIVRAVRAKAESVAGATETLSAETASLAYRSEAQAASLEEAAASMEELSGTVRENSANARQANELARDAAKVSVSGGEAVRRVAGTMEGITASSRRVQEIVSVIDGIAFQTNILALNAAVEAARAGEHGRGFAVVAAEVRSLSQRCATAATQIKELIADSVVRVDSGARQVDEAGESIGTLVESVKQVNVLMGQIAAASQQQERGIEQVSASVTQMDAAVQQNAAAVQKSAAASEKLKLDARELAETVSRFRLDEAAAKRAGPEAAAFPAGVAERLPLR
jgi:methyl-accepting chemotaxis protein